MYEELVKHLRGCANANYCFAECPEDVNGPCQEHLMSQAADAIEELSARVDRLQTFADNISKLPDCNTCLKKTMCEFLPKYGEYCRINCPAWLGVPEPPEEKA